LDFERGAIVKAGNVVGLLGDTGVKGLRAPPALFDSRYGCSPDRPDK
jgi:hypothetical protein